MGTSKRERQKANRQLRLEQVRKEAQRAKVKRNVLRWVIIGLVAAVAVIGLVYATKPKKDSTASGSTVAGSTIPLTTGSTVAGETTSTVAQAPFVYGTGECPAADGSSPATKTFTAAPKQCIDPSKNYVATMETSQGTITITLDTTRTPGTANNFVALARYHYYDGTTLFRTNTSIDIIQGGGKTNTDSPGYTIPDEGGSFTYTEGDFVMARTGAPNSAGGQFFFAAGPKTSNLDAQGTYVTFGKVTGGMDVVKKILGLHKDGDSPGEGAPNPAVTVDKVTIAES